MAAQTIVRNTPWGTGSYRTDEAQAGGTILPGHLLQWSSGKLVVHATAGGDHEALVAVQGYAGQGIDDAYASGQDVHFVRASAGWQLQMLLDAGETVSKGDPLESAGNGALQKHTPQTIDPTSTATSVTVYSRPIVGYAAEDVDNSGGSAAVRINVEIA